MGFIPPDHSCVKCPRLVALREENAAKWPEWHNGPVDSFGPLSADMLVVGLAPGLKGANRTGRPFTGDYAGLVLYPALIKHGFGTGTFEAEPTDNVEFQHVRITNAVRCLPPENKPTGPEVNACRPFLLDEIAAMPKLSVLLALGTIAHQTILRTFGFPVKDYPFKHGAWHDLPNGLKIADSYHCSRYNINTGRLTEEMFDTVMSDIAQKLKLKLHNTAQ